MITARGDQIVVIAMHSIDAIRIVNARGWIPVAGEPDLWMRLIDGAWVRLTLAGVIERILLKETDR